MSWASGETVDDRVPDAGPVATMDEFAVHVTTDVVLDRHHHLWEVLDDLLGDAPHFAAFGAFDGRRVGAQLVAHADDLHDAGRDAARAVVAAFAGQGVRAHVVEVEIITAAEFDDRVSRVSSCPVAG